MYLPGTIIHNRYRILEKIGEGGMSTVWLGVSLEDNSKVAVKVLEKTVTSNRIEDLIHFRNEATTVSKLNISGVVKIFEVGEMAGLQYLVMEYLEGKNLHDLLSNGRKFSLDEVLKIIYKICDVLKSIHNTGLIFRDLKPGNIMINDESELNIRLIDFGLSQIREYDYREKNHIAGTLLYMSPEQSGVLKKVVDERADLYSLGVIFYQLLTSRLPFYGNDINSILHQHATKIPHSPKNYNSKIPGIIEKIVLKLLEKEPEKRYQNADGLLKDIEKVQKGETDFILSSNDELLRLGFRTIMVGRDEEYSSLIHMYENAAKSKGSICLISGEAGNGKTRLSEELKNYCIKWGGIFIDGKCFCGENKMPYGVFKDAINGYIKAYSRFDAVEKDKLARKIKEYIGDLGKVILKLNPATSELIGKCPELIELEPESENNRFKMVVSNFFYALGDLKKPLVIMLDDLQWVDEGSIGILNEISYKIHEYPILIIGTYRDNEITDGHILLKYIKNGSDMGYPIESINLKPFDMDDMVIFISKLLFENDKDILEIAQFIYKKSRGNPFFAIEILKQMITDKAIIRAENRWCIEKDVLDSIQISTSIADILIRRISRLTEKEKYVLSQAAVIGRNFDTFFLLKLMDLEHGEVLKIIEKMQKVQFLEQTENGRGELKFAHDRIREAFYESMEEEQRRKAHLKLANLMETLNQNDVEKVVFSLTHHYYEGSDMKKALEYAYPSGIKAKNSCAYEGAYKYFLLAKNILDSMLGNGELRIECVIKLAEVASYISRNDEAITLLETVLEEIKSDMDKVEIYRLICLAYYNMGEFGVSYNYGKKGLALLGEILPEGNFFEIIFIIKELLVRKFQDSTRKLVYINKIKYLNSERYVKIHSIFKTLINMSAYFSIKKFIYGTIRGVNIVERKIGWSTDLGYGIGGYGGFMAASDRFEAAIKHFERAVSIFSELNNPLGIAREYQFMGVTYEFMGQYCKSIELLNKSMDILKNLGEVKEANFSLDALIRQHYYIGDYQNMNLYLEQYLGLYKKTKDMFIKNSASVYKTQYSREKGEFRKSLEYSNFMFDPSYEIKDWYNYCTLCAARGMTYLEMGKPEEALDYLEKAKEINEKNSFFKHHVCIIYPALAEAYIMKYKDTKGTNSTKDEMLLIKKIRAALRIAMKKTAKFPTHHGTSLRVLAQFKLILGNYRKAEALFKKSIILCSTYNRKYELGKSLYTYGLYLYSVLQQKKSITNIKSAYDIFAKLDSKYYLKLCVKFLGSSQSTEPVHQDKVSQSIRTSQRMSSLTTLAHKISSILNLELLLDAIMQAALELTGAQNGHLFLKDRVTGKMKLAVSKITGENVFDISTLSESILNKVINTGEGVIVTNAMEDEKYSGFKSVLINELKSVLCFPIKYNEEMKGICYLDNKITSSVFSEDDINILSVFMTQAAISIENAELYKMAITDGLTDLITHKHFRSLLDLEIEHSKKYNKFFSLILFDIDYFKKINDEYLHQAGDEVLKNIACFSKEIFRKSDVLARYGGEEFAVILPETNKEEALQYAEKLRLAIEERSILYNKVNLKVTISLGLAEYPNHAHDSSELINAADYALYISKQNGRNKSTVYEGNIELKCDYANVQ